MMNDTATPEALHTFVQRLNELLEAIKSEEKRELERLTSPWTPEDPIAEYSFRYLSAAQVIERAAIDAELYALAGLAHATHEASEKVFRLEEDGKEAADQALMQRGHYG